MINVNIRDRQCAMPECTKYPSCNFPGSTDGLYCGAWSNFASAEVFFNIRTQRCCQYVCESFGDTLIAFT